jgi:hypothetical protein
MSQKVTDAKYIFAHLQQVRGVTVTKGMKRAGFKDAGRMNRLFKKIADLGIFDLSAETIVEKIYRGSVLDEILPEKKQQVAGKGDVPVFSTFALADENLHALAVNITNLHIDQFT